MLGKKNNLILQIIKREMESVKSKYNTVEKDVRDKLKLESDK